MNRSVTLTSGPPNHVALDYASLRQEGIRHLERMAGELWTDFNTHDPGVTILEQVCYALTDLAYRIDYEIPDLLQGGATPSQNHFFTPAEILTTRPVTLLDLRKLLIDVKGIKNAWVEVDARSGEDPDLYYNAQAKTLNFSGSPLIDEPVFLKGLYRAAIEFEDTLHLDGLGSDRDMAWQAALQRLHANRGLGEDFVSVERLEAQHVQVLAHVEIDAVDSPEQVLLDIYRRLGEHISPPIRFHSLRQMLDAGKQVDDIFDGPLLDHGFIDDEELARAQRRPVLHTSDLIRAIMDTPGVKAVRFVAMATDRDFTQQPTISTEGNGERYQRWSLDLDVARAPKLDVARSAINLERNGLPVQVDEQAVANAYRTRLQQVLIQDSPPLAERDFQPPHGRDRQLGRYHSIQHQFPANYGVGEMGLSSSAAPERQAQAKQLQAYLLFFDQLLANYFTQLAHVRDLFSFQGADAQTYFAEAIDDPRLGLDGIRKEGHAERLQTIAGAADESFLAPTQRRNRFLNHLLARFAEQFTDYSLLLFNAGTDQSKLIQDKQAFLQHYPEVSSARGIGYNYLLPAGDRNRSGLETRIRRKLGIDRPDEEFLLVEHILLRPVPSDRGQLTPILTDAEVQDPYSLRLSFIFPALIEPSPYADDRFRRFVERTVREETPAHLSVDVRWLDEDQMRVVRTAYAEWLEQRRLYWTGVDFARRRSDGVR